MGYPEIPDSLEGGSKGVNRGTAEDPRSGSVNRRTAEDPQQSGVNRVVHGPAVYLIPCYLDPGSLAPLPAYILDAVKACQVFFVENERSARRYLKALWKEMVIDDYEWHPIHKAEEEVLAAFRQRLKEGLTVGIISEAGCPGVADPGQLLVGAAHQAGVAVRPLVGPSSILLALMASGLNGQQFRFCGYLPVDSAGRARAIRELEAESSRLNCTQIFIETPYRNNQLLETLLATCRPGTRLCVAADLTGAGEFIKTLTVGEWRKLQPAGSSSGGAGDGGKAVGGSPGSAGDAKKPARAGGAGDAQKPSGGLPGGADDAAAGSLARRGQLPELHKIPAIFCILS